MANTILALAMTIVSALAVINMAHQRYDFGVIAWPVIAAVWVWTWWLK